MILQCFAVYDSKVKAFANPIFLHTVEEAQRCFTEGANNPQSQLFKFPEDYSLFHIASYDSINGTFQNLKTPESLGLAQTYKL